MLKASVSPSNADTTGTMKVNAGSKKKRHWATCAAKVRTGALRVKAVVTSSDSEIGSSSSSSEGDSDSDDVVDSAFGGRGPRPHPLKTSPSISFADAPGITAQALAVATSGQEREPCVLLPAAFDFDHGASRTTLSTEGSSFVSDSDGFPDQAVRVDPDATAINDLNVDGVASGGGCADAPSRSPSNPSPSANATEETRVSSAPLAEGLGEGEREGVGDGCLAWELSSSSFYSCSSSSGDSNTPPSPIWSRSTTTTTTASGGREHGPGQAPFLPPTLSSRQVLPESPGSLDARVQRALAHLPPAARTNESGTPVGSTRPVPSSTSKTVGRGTGPYSDSNEAVRGGDAGGGAVPPMEEGLKCSETMELQQTQRRRRVVGAVDETVASFGSFAPLDGMRIENSLQVSGKMTHHPAAAAEEQQQHQHVVVMSGTELGEGDGQNALVYSKEPEGRGELELMISAVSAMVAMSVPEHLEWVLWFACCAVTVWFPARRHLGWRLTSWWSWPESAPRQQAQACTSDEVPGAPPPYVDLDVDLDIDRADFGGVGVGQAGEPLTHLRDNDARNDDNGKETCRVSSPVLGYALVESASISVKAGEGSVSEEDQLEERYRQVLAGLSETELEFVHSAGEGEKARLLHQCLEYANYDTVGAIKVCSSFCQFRLKEGWDLVLSARELEGPLRSRVHTLTMDRDRAGRGMLTFSPGMLDMDIARPAAYHKMLCYVLQEVLKEEGVQVKGLVLLVDARNVGFELLRRFALADYMRGLRMLGGAFPAKVKAIRIMHLNRAISIALSIAMPLLSAKMKGRLEIVPDAKSSDGSFTKELADPSSVPVELGVKGTWTGSQNFWDEWVDHRLAAEQWSER